MEALPLNVVVARFASPASEPVTVRLELTVSTESVIVLPTCAVASPAKVMLPCFEIVLASVALQPEERVKDAVLEPGSSTPGHVPVQVRV